MPQRCTHTRPHRWAPAVLALVALPATGLAQPAASMSPVPDAPVRYDTDLLPPEFHRERRAAVLDALPENAVALLLSAPERIRDADVEYEYRQASNLYYLTGTTEPGSALFLAPAGIVIDGRGAREILLVPPRNPRTETWSGRLLGKERAETELGMEFALDYVEFSRVLEAALADSGRTLWLDPPSGEVEPRSQLGRQLQAVMAVSSNSDRGSGARPVSVDTRALTEIIHQLRAVKQPAEIDLMQRAIDITAAAHIEALKSIEPDLHEYEIEAVIEYVFKREGAEYPGFPSIVGSGENSIVLHYSTNRKQMRDGEMVLMDIGAELHGYSADVTRTVPVNGKFSPEQRALYDVVLRANKAAIDAATAGASTSDPERVAAQVLAEGLTELGLLGNSEDLRGLRRFYMHGVSHMLGMSVHDVGRAARFEPGFVVTIEPGLYVRPAEDIDPKWWNIGIRIEDDVLVTELGPVVLSRKAPKEPDDIERIMAASGIGNVPVGNP